MKAGKSPTADKKQQKEFSQVPIPDKFNELSSMARLAWFALCYFTWKTNWEKDFRRGECWPSLGRLSKMMGVSINTAKSGLRDLEEKGLIHPKQRRKGGRITSTLYVLTPYGVRADYISESDISNSDVSKSDISEIDNGDVSGFDNGDVSGFDIETYNIETDKGKHITKGPAPEFEPLKEKASVPSGADDANTSQEERPLTADEVKGIFATVWKSYPNHGKEAAGLRAFRKLIPAGTQRQVAQEKISDLTARLDEALEKRWTDRDTGEIEEKFVPYFVNFLGDNYDL